MDFAHRVIKRYLLPSLLVISLSASLFSCRPNEQLSGMYELPKFDVTAVCDFKEKDIIFDNTSNSETVIRGAAISLGTNIHGSYDFKSYTIGSVTTPTPSGDVQNLTIPPRTSYSFKVRYTPTAENLASDVAYFDIAYSSPNPGTIQVHLDGSSGARAQTCVSADQNAHPVEGLDGAVRFRVTKLVAATSALTSAMDSDQGIAPFGAPLGYVQVPLTLSRSAQTLTLPAIPSSAQLSLPPPGERAAGPIQDLGITIPTTITTRADITGRFDIATGEVTLRDVPVTMDGDFHTEFVLDLTTEPRVNNTTPIVNPAALARLGALWNPATNSLRGQRINTSDNGSVVLVGFVKVDRVTNAATTELQQLQSKAMAVVIYGNIIAGTN